MIPGKVLWSWGSGLCMATSAFLLLIKSMSKIQANKTMQCTAHPQDSSGKRSDNLKKELTKIQQKHYNSYQDTRKLSCTDIKQIQAHQPHSMKDQLNLNYSRFQPYHLHQGVENIKVDRQTEQNKPNAEKNLQQSNQYFSDEDFQFGTPIKTDSRGFSQAKQGQKSHSTKNNAVETATVERKTRPKEKGLRKLSGKAFKIVKELGEATYKQVAMKLIHEQRDDQESDIGQQKQGNNIKRRVYDALNVLIAMGILFKRGRNIVYQADSLQSKYHSVYLQLQEQKSEKMEKLRTKALEVAEKKEDIKRISAKLDIIKSLIGRNRARGGQAHRISFPFVCLLVSLESQACMQLSKDRLNFKVTTSDQYSFFGDVDFISKHPTHFA